MNQDSKLDTDSSDNETHDGDYTIYECPGLAIVSWFGKIKSFKILVIILF